MANIEKGKEVTTRRHRIAPRKGCLEKTKSGTYRLVVQINGKKIRVSTKTSDKAKAKAFREVFMTRFVALDELALAEKLADEVVLARMKVEKAKMAEEQAQPALRIDDALEAYLQDPKRNLEAPTTIGTDKNTSYNYGCFCRWIREHHPKCVEMRHITKNIAEEYLAHLRRSISASTCGRHLAVFKRIWNVLGEKAKCTANPWATLKKPKATTRGRANFKPEEVTAIFKKLEPGTELHTLCTIGVYTGLRLSDAAQLKWSSINFSGNCVSLLPQKTKMTQQFVDIPMHKDLRKVLEALPRQGEYVLPDAAREYQHNPTTLTDRFKKFLISAGFNTNEKPAGYKHCVAIYGFHSWRHTFVTTMAEMGVSITVIQQIVGHMTEEMTERYCHISNANAKDAIASIPSVFGGGGDSGTTAPSVVDKFCASLGGMSRDDLLAVRDKIDTLLVGHRKSA